MKLDTSGLESTAPLSGIGNEFLSGGFQMTPSFELPNATDVSSCSVWYVTFAKHSCCSN